MNEMLRYSTVPLYYGMVLVSLLGSSKVATSQYKVVVHDERLFYNN